MARRLPGYSHYERDKSLPPLPEMPTYSSSSYLLDRNRAGSVLLNKQHEIVKRNVGYLLHPAIRDLAHHGDFHRIADVGTGTGIFLFDLHRDPLLAPDRPLVMHGFDISDAQFPKKMPSSIYLHVHDAREPFDENFQGCFDVVHLRYLTLGLQPEDWLKVARNVAQLLRPGGMLQWMEFDMVKSWQQPYRGKAPRDDDLEMGYESLRPAGGLFARLYENQLNGWVKLEQVLQKAGLENVMQERVSLDGTEKDRDEMTLISLSKWVAGMLAAAREGKEVVLGMGPVKTKWINKTVKMMLKDVERGAHIREDQYIFFAKKPVRGKF